VSRNLRDVTVLWRFNACSDGNLKVVVLLRRRSEVGINSFICHQGKGRVGRPSVTEETVDRVRETFTRSPMKSVRRASRELKIPEHTVRKILRKRLQLYPYKLQLVQKLQTDDPSRWLAFCEDLRSRMETKQGLSERVIFSDEATLFIRKNQQAQYPDMGIPESSRSDQDGT